MIHLLPERGDTAGRWFVSLVVRCFNERADLEKLFPILDAQDYPGPVELVLVDSGSSDGTRDMPIPDNARFVNMAAEDFTFGRSLNVGCRAARGAILVLLSAHAFPTSRDWLRRLVEPFARSEVGMVFGRQVGDPGKNPIESAELARDYPERDAIGLHNFSNANGAIPRDLFLARPFDEAMQGGEEIWMVKKVHECGYRVAYASRAAVEHTHPSDPESDYRRWFWKGYNFERYLYCGRKRLGWPVLVARYLTKLGRGMAYVVRKRRWTWLVRMPFLQWYQTAAFHRGLKTARREGPDGPTSRIEYRDLVVPGWVRSRTGRG